MDKTLNIDFYKYQFNGSLEKNLTGHEFNDIKITSLFPIEDIFSSRYFGYVNENPNKIVWFLFEPSDPRIDKAKLYIRLYLNDYPLLQKEDILEIILKCGQIHKE